VSDDGEDIASGVVSDPTQAPFAALVPDVILSAVERFGLYSDGRFLALNSYENRVFRIGVEDGPAVVAKFYRPGRWSDAAIQEEHDYAHELGALEIPVAVPLRDTDGQTLAHHHGYRVALFPMLAGEWPELDRPGRLAWVGRFLGRIHAVGRLRAFRHRPAVEVEELGRESARLLLEQDFLPDDIAAAYERLSRELLDAVEQRMLEVPHFSLRLHGDCHPGNVLWGQDGPAFVDLDDARNGPAVQDIWMLLSGPPHEQAAQTAQLLEGYETFAEFDRRELALVEPLRTLRLVYYAGWIARRWHDPAFPLAFPWFGSHGYWRGHLDDLRTQQEAMSVAPEVL
jgi:Ser/Thr protein kinase RdoA (MazF antagonist)